MRRHVPEGEKHFDSYERDHDLDSVVIWLELVNLRKEIRQMADALDGIRSALAAEDTLLGQVATFLAGVPAATAAAVAASEAGDTAGAAAIQADIQAHTATLSAALAAAGPQAPAGTSTPTPAVPVVTPPAVPVGTPPAPVNPPTSTL
jgi:hypothetical protein